MQFFKKAYLFPPHLIKFFQTALHNSSGGNEIDGTLKKIFIF